LDRSTPERTLEAVVLNHFCQSPDTRMMIPRVAKRADESGKSTVRLERFDLYLPKMHPAAQDFHHAARTAAALDRFEMLSLFRLEIPQVLKRLKVWELPIEEFVHRLAVSSIGSGRTTVDKRHAFLRIAYCEDFN
jgi:hypothetical protein